MGIWSPLSSLWASEGLFILVSKDTTCFLILIVIAHFDDHFVMAIASPMAVVQTLFSFFLGSGNTPIAVWGTHLDLIQNPQIRAKHGGKEHINVSPLAGPCLHTMTHGSMGHLHILGWRDKGVGMTIFLDFGAVGLKEQSLPQFTGFCSHPTIFTQFRKYLVTAIFTLANVRDRRQLQSGICEQPTV